MLHNSLCPPFYPHCIHILQVCMLCVLALMWEFSTYLVLLGVDLVVMTMVEVMWAFVASGQVSVQVIMPHLVRMLQSHVS